MRKLGVVVVLSLLAVSVAVAQEKKKEMPAPQPAGKPVPDAKIMKAPETPPAPPQPPPGVPTAPPKPGPEHAAIAMLAQNWNCDGTAKDPKTMADVAYKSTLRGKWDLNKLWIAVEYKQNIKTKPPMKFTGKGFIGWDASGKNYMFGGVDDWGGYISLRATGWEGDNLVFMGDAGGPMGKMPMRMTFTKGANDKLMSWKFEMQMGKDWMQAQSETCKR